MQLDQTKIAIRERTIIEIFDLSLHVLREYIKPLSLAILIGFGIVGAINCWLCYPIIKYSLASEATSDVDLLMNYLFQLGLLFFITQPIASIPITMYLGQSLFTERPNFRKMAKDIVKMFPQTLWAVFVLRGPALLWFLWLVDPPSATVASNGGVIMLLFFVLVSVFILRGIRPFVLEVILLEQNPHSAKRGSVMTTGNRSKMLHSMHSGLLFWRFIISSMFCCLLLFTMTFATILLYAFQFEEYITYQAASYIAPAVLTLLGAYLAVVRFLGYLDLRIRNEGWEVELLLRAEGARLERQLV